MLPKRRCLRVQARDRGVRRRHDPSQLVPRPGKTVLVQSRSAGEQTEELVEHGSGGLVGFDPWWRSARIAQHPVREGPVARRRIVLERQAGTLVRQAVERAVLDRFADLPLDERLTHAFP